MGFRFGRRVRPFLKPTITNRKETITMGEIATFTDIQDRAARAWATRQVAEGRALGYLPELRQELAKVDREKHSQRVEARKTANGPWEVA